MFEKARKDAFARVNEDFRAAARTLDEAKALLARIGGSLGADMSGNVGTLSDLAHRLKKRIAAGNISQERFREKRGKNKTL